MKNVTSDVARAACNRLGAKQVVIIAFDGEGAFTVLSCGKTQAGCIAVRPVCDTIADMLMDGRINSPEES